MTRRNDSPERAKEQEGVDVTDTHQPAVPRHLQHEESRTFSPDIRDRLFAYLGGVINELRGKPVIISGVEDHVPVLAYLPPTLAVSDAMRTLKANSSRWVHQSFPALASFAWQAGYAAFAVSRSALEDVRRYIQEQEEHHRTMTFQDEYRAFLRKHGIEFDERYVWD